MNANVEAKYKVLCPNLHGANSKDFVTVINRRVKMENCKKCKWYKEFKIEKMKVCCSFKKEYI